VQNLPQIADLYEKSWETFFGNSGLKLFFQIDDDFTRSYLARQLGELETTRQTRSGSQSSSSSDSTTAGDSMSYTSGRSTSRRPLLHFRTSKQTSSGYSDSRSHSRSRGTSASTTDGWGEAVHKRPLLNPDEIGRMLARIDDRRRPGYPGLVLALLPGEHPLLARRVNYFDSRWFTGFFDPHPNHPPPPTLAEVAARAAQPSPLLLTRPSVSMRDLAQLIGAILVVLVGLSALGMGGYWLYQHAGTLFAGAAAPAPAGSASTPPVSAGTAPVLVAPSRPAEAPPSSEPQPSAAYTQGVAEWTALKAWVSSETGDRRAGIDYWSANRHVQGHATCAKKAEEHSAEPRSRTAFADGCLAAKQRLEPIDARRKEDADYRIGFKDEAKRSPI
jgi:hypothetical protein